jgi:hypothetical protein
MNRAVGFIVAGLLAGSGCGDNAGPPAMNRAQLLDRLRALPGVTVTEATTEVDHASYLILHFTQPVDHFDPAQSQGTFQQEVSLLHRNEHATVPMIVHTSGYSDYYLDTEVELTKMFDANQVSIEHRYFGSSRPVPTDWSKLTLEQMAADEHAIITALRTIYDGPFVTTGGSKGGTSAVFHHRRYPDDADGTVAYVAPVSFGTPDPRYPAFFDSVGPDWCRHKVQQLALEMLVNRRAQMEDHAQRQSAFAYDRIAVGPAVESAIAGFEWAFWQYWGVDHCGKLPETTDSDQALFEFLDKVSPVSECSDQKLTNLEAYYYQTYNQLGYPDYSVPYLGPHMRYTDADYEHELPTHEPAYDSTAMHDILDYFGKNGARMLLIYGEWDPWIEGRLALGQADDGGAYVEPEGTHGSSITGLRDIDHQAALGILERWTGITPRSITWRRTTGLGTNRVADQPVPQMRPVLLHAPGTAR